MMKDDCEKHILMFLILLFVTHVFASEIKADDECRIQKIIWNGTYSAYDEAQMSSAVGIPCSSWFAVRDKLISYYENHGFVAATMDGFIDENMNLVLTLNRGQGWVWARAENLDSSGTKKEVFQKLSGIKEGFPVSLFDLEQSERKLSRMGYFSQTAPTLLFRNPSRNIIVPAFSMRKASFSEAEGILTYSSDDDVWEGIIHVNLFNIAGTARDLQMEGFSGEDSRHLNGLYKEPWIFGTEWNVVLRGSFDEEKIYADSIAEQETTERLERLIVGEVGLTRDIGFNFNVGVYFGVTEDDKHSSFEMTYISLDRFVLPRNGLRLESALTWKMDRPDSLENYLNAYARVTKYLSVYGNFIVRYTGAAGGIFPSEAKIKRTDLFSLGGMDDFKGMQYHVIRSRSYGLSEAAILWQDGYDLSIEFFYQPGLYRRLSPGHGWAREQDYGLGFTQYRKNWSVNLYYALRNGCDYLDGVLGFGVKTLF